MRIKEWIPPTAIVCIVLGAALYFGLWLDEGIDNLNARQRVKAKEIEVERTERCTNMCADHGGMAYHFSQKVGWGSWMHLCVCKDLTEVKIP